MDWKYDGYGVENGFAVFTKGAMVESVDLPLKCRVDNAYSTTRALWIAVKTAYAMYRWTKKGEPHTSSITWTTTQYWVTATATTYSRNMGNFPLTNTRIKLFHIHLTRLDGGRRNERTAKAIVRDVSKFLASPTTERLTGTISLNL